MSDAGPSSQVPFGGHEMALPASGAGHRALLMSAQADYTWAGGAAGGDWNTSDNWVSSGSHGIPGAGDIVDTAGAAFISTDGATVAALSCGDGVDTILVGDLTVTGDLDFAILSGGTVQAGTVNAVTFEGVDLSAGVIANGAKLDAGTVSAGQLVGAVISGAEVSAALIAGAGSGSSLQVEVDAGALSGALTLSANTDRFVVSGGTAVITGDTEAKGDGGPVFAPFIGCTDGTLTFDGGLTLSDEAQLWAGDSNYPGIGSGTISARSLTVGGVGSALFDENSDAVRLFIARNLTVGEAGTGEFYAPDYAVGRFTIGGNLEAAVKAGSVASVTLGHVSIGGDLSVAVGGAAECDLSSGQVTGAVDIGVSAGASGTVYLDAGTVVAGGGVTVGGDGSGTLQLYSGTLQAGDLVVGDSAGGVGSLTLEADSQLTVAGMTVGAESRNATVNDTSSEIDISGDLSLGESQSASGVFSATLSATLDVGGDMVVGGLGSGSLVLTTLVSSGAEATISGGATLGEDKGGRGSVTVSGSLLTLAGDLTIGESGKGAVVVDAGGKLVRGSLAIPAGATNTITLGEKPGAKGSLTLAGAGSEVDTFGLVVGGAGAGSLVVRAAATLITTGDADIAAESVVTTQKAAVTAAVWSVGGGLTVGDNGHGGLSVAGGGRAVVAGDITVGGEMGAVGSVSVSGARTLSGHPPSPSLLTWRGVLAVGEHGSGALRVTGGGVTSATSGGQGAVEIGVASGAVGSVTVIGSGSQIRGATLAVGGTDAAAGGSGLLTVGSGAAAHFSAATVWKGGRVVASSGGDVQLGRTVDDGLLDAASAVISVLGGFTGSGAVAIAGGGRFSLNASSTMASNRVRLASVSGTFSLTGGSAADVFEMPAGDLTSGDVVAGGAGRDELVFTAAGAVAASAWDGVTGIDVLKLAKGVNRLTLAEALVADTDAGRLVIAGGTGSDTIDASAVSSGVVIFDGASAARTDFTGGAGVVSASGGGGADVFRFAAGQLTSADRIVGGGGQDTLDFDTAGTVAAAAFARVAGIDAIELASGANSLTLTDGLAERSDADTLRVLGGAGDDRVEAASLRATATFIFTDEGGRDVVRGGKGVNDYQFERAAGRLAIYNAYTGGSAAHGELQFGGGLTDQRLWLERSGSNLVIDVIGTSAAVTVEGWFATNASAKVAEITAGGLVLDAQVQRLVTAMATYETAHPTFNPTSAGAVMPADTALQAAVTSAWHR